MTDKQKLTACRTTLTKFPVIMRVFYFKGLAVTKEMFETGELR